MHAFVNGGHLHYVETGPASAIPVIFLHGFPFSLAMWDEQRQLVGRSHRAIAYDIRGHGMSDVGDGQYSIEGHVDDLFGVMDILGIDRPVIVGLSMGGYIALRALERDQARFRGAVLCDTKSEADTDDGRIKRANNAASVKRIGSAAFAKEFVKGVFTASSAATAQSTVDTIQAVIAATPPLSIAGTLLALAARTDTTASLSSLRLPVMILVGEEDVTTPPSASRSIHERIPGSTMHIIPHAAHLSNLENPSAFNSHLMEFLATIH